MATPKITKIGKYEVLDVIGRGGMGTVYKAIDPAIGRIVAIKKVTSVMGDDPDLLKRFYREAQSTGKLQHPNIVTLHDLGDQEGVPYLVMEFLEGQSLELLIKENHPYSIAEKLSIVIRVCEGLGYAHQRQVIHRDVKPANIVVLRDGGVKVVDFGIAQLGNERFTRTGMVIGSLYYMSPEQIEGADIDARSDIYSTGIVLFEFLCGDVPFRGKDPASTLAKVLHETVPPLSKFVQDYPLELDEILKHALAKDRNVRYGSMEEFAFELQSVHDKLSQERIASLLRTAEISIETRDWERARDHLRQVLKLDKQHRRANELLRQVQTQIQKQQVTEQVRQLRQRADDALGMRKWDDALVLLEQAVALDPGNTELAAFRDSVQRSSRLRNEALRRAELARRAGDLNAAKAAVEEALAVDPTDTTAKALNAILAKEIAERTKRKKLDELVIGAQQQIADRRFTAALDLLYQAEAIDASAPQVGQLIQSASAGRESERRRQALELACADVENLLNRDDYSGACARAEEALLSFPGNEGLLKLKAFAEEQRDLQTRRQFIDSEITAARQLFEAGQLVRAQGILDAALLRYPDDSRLSALLRSVADAIAQQEAQRREEARRENEKRRYISLQVATAADLQRSGQTLEALGLVRNALLLYPDSPELKEQAARIAELAAREEAARERAEAEARQRSAEIERELISAHQFLDSKQTEQAVIALEQAARRYPESEALKTELRTAQKRLAAERAQRDEAERLSRRRSEIEREIASARQVLQSGRTAQAVTALEQAVLRYAESEELKTELQSARKRLDAEEAQHEEAERRARRRAEIEQEIASARRLLQSKRTAQAVTALEQAVTRYAESEELKTELQSARKRSATEQAQREEAERQARRRAEIEQEVASARQMLQSKRTAQAVTALEQAVTRYAESDDLKTELQSARKRLKAERAEQEEAERQARRRAEIDEAIASARQLVLSGQTAQAISALEDAFRRFPENHGLKQELAAAKQRRKKEIDELKRRDAEQEAEEYRKRQEAQAQLSESAPEAPADLSTTRPIRDQEFSATKAYTGRPVAELAQASRTRPIAAAPPSAPALDRAAVRSLPKPLTTDKKQLLVLGVAAGIVVAIAIAAFVFWPKLIDVRFETNPQGAKVAIVEKSCTAPCVLKLRAGTYAVHVSLGGYGAIDRQIVVNASQPEVKFDLSTLPPAPVGDQPKPATVLGTLLVRAQLPGAKVLVDEALSGITNPNGSLQVPLEEGDHEVQVTKEGYREIAPKRVRIQKGRESALDFKLEAAGPTPPQPIESYLTLSTQPGSGVRIDHKPVSLPANGMAPITVQPGDHLVEITHDGYKPWSKSVRVKRGENVQLLATLEKAPGTPNPPNPPPSATLTVRTGISRAEVRIDSRTVGTTSDDGNYSVEVPPGSHHIEVAKDGYQTWSAQENLSPGQSANLSASLSKNIQPKNQGLTDSDMILSALGRLQQAYSSKDIDAVCGVWPGCDRKTIGKVFKQAKSVSQQFEVIGSVQVPEGAETAAVVCKRTVTTAYGSEKAAPSTGTVTIRFRKQNNTWLIDSIIAQ